MKKRWVFLDANAIIEAFRINVWAELSEGFHLETVEECEREALTGRTDRFNRVEVDATRLRAGLRASHPVGRVERNQLINKHPSCMEMDPGEKDLFAHLFVNHHPLTPLIAVDSADKGVIVRAHELGWLGHLVSLEELLGQCRIASVKLADLDLPHRTQWLSQVRTKVMLGVIP